MRRSSRSRRSALAFCAWGALWSLSGCSFLADEFGWYDRLATTARPGATPSSGTVDRP